MAQCLVIAITELMEGNSEHIIRTVHFRIDLDGDKVKERFVELQEIFEAVGLRTAQRVIDFG